MSSANRGAGHQGAQRPHTRGSNNPSRPNTPSQAGNRSATNNGGASSQNEPTRDRGDPVGSLGKHGLTENTKYDLASLAEALGNIIIKMSTAATKAIITKEHIPELKSIEALLRESANKKDDLTTILTSINELKESLMNSASNGHQQQTSGYTYAAAAANGTNNHNSENETHTKKISNHLDILVSMRGVTNPKETFLYKLPANEAVGHTNDCIINYFGQPENGNHKLDAPIRSLRILRSGHLLITAKDNETLKTLLQDTDWCKELDVEGIEIPHRTYSVVAHRAPADTFNANEDISSAIDQIQEENEHLGLDFSIKSLTWLNGEKDRETDGFGPLRIDFKTKESANTAIGGNLSLGKNTCRTSIFVPRDYQCFRCQDWGHRATSCSRDVKCGLCAGGHSTAEHKCEHDKKCKDNKKCDRDKLKCANCSGSHASWIRACPTALQAFNRKARSATYKTGRYENETPWTYADIHKGSGSGNTNH